MNTLLKQFHQQHASYLLNPLLIISNTLLHEGVRRNAMTYPWGSRHAESYIKNIFLGMVMLTTLIITHVRARGNNIDEVSINALLRIQVAALTH